MVVIDRGSEAAGVPVADVKLEPGLGFGGQVPVAVSRGCDLNVEVSRATARQVVFESRVGYDESVVLDLEIKQTRDFNFDFLWIAVRFCLAGLMQRSIHFGFQLEVEPDAKVGAASSPNLLRFFKVGTEELGVMFRLAGLDQARVNALPFGDQFHCNEHFLPRFGEGDGFEATSIRALSVAPKVQKMSLDEVVLFQEL